MKEFFSYQVIKLSSYQVIKFLSWRVIELSSLKFKVKSNKVMKLRDKNYLLYKLLTLQTFNFKLDNSTTLTFKNFLLYKLLTLLIILFSSTVFSQNYILEIMPSSMLEKEVLNYKKKHKDSTSIYLEIEKFIAQKHQSGYLSASFDSIIFDSIYVNAYFFRGEKYLLKEINFIDIDKNTLNKIGIKQKKLENKPFSFEKINTLNEQILEYYENNGYPFVSTKIDTAIFNEKNISLSIIVNKNKFYKIDSIYVLGETDISANFIQKYIGIQQSDSYNELKISKIDNKINNLEFLTSLRSTEVEFHETDADIYIYLKKKKANRFNGIIGFLPNRTNEKLLITGEIDLKLVNSLKKGEQFAIKWEKLKPESQRLNLSLEYPYFFKTNFGISEKFSLSKEDTSFIDIKNHVGLRYFFSGENFIESYISSQKSIVLLQKRTQNSNFANISTNLYGLAFGSYRLDYKYNPSKGYFFYGKTGLGNKNLEDSIKSLQVEASIELEFYLPIINNFVLKYKNYSAIKDNKSGLYENEFYKIGGFKTLRGFDEEIIKTPIFSINTLELRFLFDENSNFYLFYDIAYIHPLTSSESKNNLPMGFGAGINFSTKAGIFALSYALGKQPNNPILINSAKIHFGFISIF